VQGVVFFPSPSAQNNSPERRHIWFSLVSSADDAKSNPSKLQAKKYTERARFLRVVRLYA
jgi:hypothetical protein